MNSLGEPTGTRIPIVFHDTETAVTVMVARAMTFARSAQVRWARTPMVRRLELIRELRRLIAENAASLSEASASARQRPAVESLLAEVLPVAEGCRFLERKAEKILAPRRLGRRGLPLWLMGVDSEIHRDPLGVVLIIGPGNYPLLLPGLQVIQTLVAGNAVLLKPGVGGTAAAQALCELIVRAGFDPQLVTLLPETSAAARIAIEARPDKVIFTGSAATGEIILGQLASELIPATMELSGCDAVIICDDADMNLVVKALTFGLKINDGATCMAPKRVFISASRVTELEGGLADSLDSNLLSLTPCFSAVKDAQSSVSAVSTALGGRAKTAEAVHHSATSNTGLKPGANERGSRLRPLLDDALHLGAHIIAGKIRDDGTIITPLILGGVSPASQLLRADVFASVLAIVTVADDREAVQRANDCNFALAASIFSRDETAAYSMAAQINAGSVCINDLIVPTADARVPFGGRARSGFGVTRGAEGLLELTTPKVVTVSRSKFRPAFDPPQPGDEQMFQAYLKLTHGRGFKSRWAALRQFIRALACRRKGGGV